MITAIARIALIIVIRKIGFSKKVFPVLVNPTFRSGNMIITEMIKVNKPFKNLYVVHTK